jgi:hypothetical protein
MCSLVQGIKLRSRLLSLSPSLSHPLPTQPPTSQTNHQAKPPCATASTTRDYVLSSADANYYGKPDKTVRVTGAGALDQCKKLCQLRTERPKAGPSGCAAFSLTVVPHRSGDPSKPASRFCNFFNDDVPHRLCAAGDKDDLCQAASEGSYRVRYQQFNLGH